MRKLNTISIALALTSALIGTANVVNADTSESSSVEVKSGSAPKIVTDDNGNLNVPSFGFGTVNIDEQPHVLTAKDYINRINTSNTYNKSSVRVSDFSGSHNGWKLSAELGTMHVGTDSSNQLKGASLTLNPNSVNPENATDGTSANLPIANKITLEQNGGPQELMTANAGQGAGVFTTDLKNSTLSIPADSSLKSGEYVAPLTYTMSATPTPAKTIMNYELIFVDSAGANIKAPVTLQAEESSVLAIAGDGKAAVVKSPDGTSEKYSVIGYKFDSFTPADSVNSSQLTISKSTGHLNANGDFVVTLRFIPAGQNSGVSYSNNEGTTSPNSTVTSPK